MQRARPTTPNAPTPAPRSAFLRSSPRPLRSLAFAAFAAVALGAAAANAQDLVHKAPPQDQPILIQNATVHTVSGETIENGYVYFVAGTIEAIGAEPTPRFASPPVVIDGAGLHVWPGMIAPVTQLGLSEIQAIRQTRDHDELPDVSPEVYAAVAVNPDSTLLPVTRSNGVLLAGVFPTGGTIPGRASVMHLDGWTWEQMAVKPDAGLVLSWPQARPVRAWWMDQTDEEQTSRTRERLNQINETFDTAAAYAEARRADSNHPVDLRWEAMRSIFPKNGTADPAADGEQLPVFIQAQDADQITQAVTWAVERGLKAVIVGGRDADQCADLLARHDVPVIVGGTHRFPRRSDAPYDEPFTLPAALQAAGVRWCMASADDTAHERNLPYNAATAVAYGLDPDAAVRALTLSTAEILGVADRYGSLEPGKSATLIITNGHPLEVTTNVLRAFIDGREIDLSNKQTGLAEKYREKYRQGGAGKRK